jgi:hypothetical protein
LTVEWNITRDEKGERREEKLQSAAPALSYLLSPIACLLSRKVIR